MTRSDHRRAHPFYGVALSVAALPSCWAASLINLTWLAASIYIAAACAAAVGFTMTLRDLPT